MNFFEGQRDSCEDCQWRKINLSVFIKTIAICVPKLNESLTGLELKGLPQPKIKHFMSFQTRKSFVRLQSTI